MRAAALLLVAALAVAAAAEPAAKPAPSPAAPAPAAARLITARARPRAVAGRPAPPPTASVDEVALNWRPLQTEPVTLAPGVAPNGAPKPRAAVAGAPSGAPLKRAPKRLCAPGCVVCDAAGPCVVCAGGHAANEDGVCQPTAGATPTDAGAAPCGAGCAECQPELGCVACEDGHFLNGAAGCAAMPTLEAALEDARMEAVTSDDADMVVDALASVAESAFAEVNDAAAVAEAEGETPTTAEEEETQAAPTDAPALVSLADAPPSRTQAATSDDAGCPPAGPKCVACDGGVPAPPGFASCKTCAPGYYAFAWAPGDVPSATSALASCHPCARLGCAPGACADGRGCTGCPAGAVLNTTPARAIGPNGVAGVCGVGGDACPVNCVAA